ncbi:Arginase [compost metagenome]
MSIENSRTLRLVFPQWQGGVNPLYHLGSRLLAWLAPTPTGPVEEVPVIPPTGEALPVENGVVGRTVLLQQLGKARELIDKHQPDRLVVLGGDCMIDLAPFAYLNERYEGDLAVLWVDAHPDIMTPAQFNRAHAMVLGCLLGHGDVEFQSAVARPLKPENVLYVGLHDPTDWEAGEMQRLGLRNVSPAMLAAEGNRPVLDWLASTGAKHVAIHLDLDVLDPVKFRSLLFAKPDGPAGEFEGVAQGELSIEALVDLLQAVGRAKEVVGLGVAEHLPWEALALQEMLAQLPLIGTPSED